MQASFKDLVIDAVDARAAAGFWSATLGLTSERNGEGFVLRGDNDTDTVWVNAVAEPKSVKNRVHIDVHTPGLDALTDRGARVIDDSHRWTIMNDPDGQEFCAFVRTPDRLPDLRFYELVVDCADPLALASWWAERFGVPVHRDTQQPWAWIDGGGLPWEMVFVPVPEAKTVKNRVHWDVLGDPEDFLDAGASLLRSRDDEIGWDILADPEGNEFCVFRLDDH